MARQGPFAPAKDGVQVKLKVVPRASRACIDGLVTDAQGVARLRLRVTAAPAEGEANEAVTKLLAKTLRIPASSIAIVAGAHDRNKTVHIRGEAEALLERLRSMFEGQT
jgi:uncharacterized protein (TIGR00251 family)